jgi:8-oxo-dGTP pyrophosphatase MutT (NUDIX family)
MEFTSFIHKLEDQLKLPLPGLRAQLKMSSMSRVRELMKDGPREDAVQSSVLVLLYPADQDINLVLMLRPNYEGVHAGQISLPGGKYEDGDESLIYTALREAKEEIGIDPLRVQLLGQLTEIYIPPSNYLVTPIVGYLVARPIFTPDPCEVAAIIEITLKDLLCDLNIHEKEMKLRNGDTIEVPSYYIDGNIIWGATAMILSELKEIISEIKY